MRLYKVLGRNSNAQLVSLVSAFNRYVPLPQLVYEKDKETCVPPEWKEQGFGLYAYTSRSHAVRYYEMHKWIEDNTSTTGIHALELWWGLGEDLDNPYKFTATGYYAGLAYKRGGLSALRAYMEKERRKPFCATVDKISHNVAIVNSFTPTDHLPWRSRGAYASEAYSREYEAGLSERNDFEISTARRFVEQGYVGKNGRLPAIGRRKLSTE